MYSLFRPLLFRLEPERAHALTLGLLRLAGALPPVRQLLSLWFRTPERPVEAFGLQFTNPVGLAAGYDKDGLGWRGLTCLGFGHIEVGTVTLHPQRGNPRPRLFRLPQDQALINRMGFPSRGAEFVARKLSRQRFPGSILGVNIGKNKNTPLERANLDYLALMRRFAPLAGYLAVNVSSPNTIGLRKLQGREALDSLLGELRRERTVLAEQLGRYIPLLIKLAPDLSDEELNDALEVIVSQEMDGVIASNTTITRDGLSSPHAQESGGLSGKPLYLRSLQMVQEITRRTQGKLPIISVGGIDSPDDALAMFEAGARLVQIYTGLVYQGPGLVKKIICGLK